MKRRKKSKAQALWLSIIATIFAVALVLYPLKGRSAPAEKGSATPASAATAGSTKAASKEGKDVVAASKDAKESKDTKESKKGAKGKSAASEEPAPAPPPAEPEDLTTIPIGMGLPVRVSVGVYFLEINSFDDTKGEFEATIDVRYRWTDPRLAFEAKETLRGYREFLGKAAEAELAKLWTPTIEMKNQFETGSYVGRRLRILPSGLVETITRTSGKFKASVNPETFPFDRQKLAVELIVRDITTDSLRMRFDKEDVEFSRAARTAKLDGWEVGLVDLKRAAVAGWNGDRYSTVTATLFVDRQPGSSIASVFIPLIASLLIPLLALWMNRASEEGFEVDAFELANMGIGGLFSVIALSFAIYSSNPIIASSDNTVTRLFGLNYATLALSLAIVVVFFRYQLPRRLFGIHVQEEAFHFLSWAIPLLSLATSAAFLLIAAA